ncbi:MAG: TatD family hydrolase [Spirochaetales bacterium]|jgi:TatD DNase family protein|nr:TatD family hydrolase [Spirochaetales bacterium]
MKEDLQERFIDIGVNLLHSAFDRDREEVIAQAAQAGVSPLIITGTSLAVSRRAADYGAGSGGRLWCTAGVHPHEASTWSASTGEALGELCRREEVKAVGECGLDYCRDFSPRPSQRRCFEEQLALACERGLPAFLHQREAFDDFYGILKNAAPLLPGFVVHCFTGTQKELEAFLDLGGCIGLTGWICDERRRGDLPRLAPLIPPDRLLLETDAPFLKPRDLRGGGSRNVPANLAHIAAVVARLCGKSRETLARETFSASCRFFGLEGNLRK